MKATAALTCLGSLYAGALWMEYQMSLLLGTGYFLFAVGSAAGILAAAVSRAPEGSERADGFHIRPRTRSAGFVRGLRPSQRHIGRGWT